MIFMQKQTVRGLTTAAGIWTTAGIGMAMGAGLYEVAGGVTLLVLLGQKLLHAKFKWLSAPKSETLSLRIANEPSAVDQLLRTMGEKGVSILGYHVEQAVDDGGLLQLDLSLRFSGDMRPDQLMSIIQQHSFVKSVETAS